MMIKIASFPPPVADGKHHRSTAESEFLLVIFMLWLSAEYKNPHEVDVSERY